MSYCIIENHIIVNIAEASATYAAEQGWIENQGWGIGWVRSGDDFVAPAAPSAPTQFERDQARYQKRAAVRDALMAYMAADNMSRVRAEVWTVADLTGLLADPAVAAANALMGTLSYELAAAQINAAQTPLLTPEIKADWTARLEAHYYLEG